MLDIPIPDVIEKNPTASTVMFGGNFISLTRISKRSGIDLGYVSMIFSGKRSPSLDMSHRIASAMGIPVGKFVACLIDHQRIVGK